MFHSKFVYENYEIDKLNIASIGNLVSQLHIHIVGRYFDDPCWPGVVWGTSHYKAYESEEIVQIQQKLEFVLLILPNT